MKRKYADEDAGNYALQYSNPDHDSEDDRPAGLTVFKHQREVPKDLLKYWHQRNRLFSDFDDYDIWLTYNGWFSVTPEQIARKIADHMIPTTVAESELVILDGFCGWGQNAIQFALSNGCKKVIAVDSDVDAIKCARHNAKLYEIDHKIEFVCDDIFTYIERMSNEPGDTKIDAIFMSPPWGGPDYFKQEKYNLDYLEPKPCKELLEEARKLSQNIAIYIPRNSNLEQLAELVPNGENIAAIHYCLGAQSKAICAYFGDSKKDLSLDLPLAD